MNENQELWPRRNGERLVYRAVENRPVYGANGKQIGTERVSFGAYRRTLPEGLGPHSRAFVALAHGEREDDPRIQKRVRAVRRALKRGSASQIARAADSVRSAIERFAPSHATFRREAA